MSSIPAIWSDKVYLRRSDGPDSSQYGRHSARLDRKLLGDVDGDGIVDIGGAKNTVGMWGISLGGILSGVAAGAEPTLNAVSPNAGGGGLVDIAVRSSQRVPQAVVLPMLGPFVVGCLPTDGHERPIPREKPLVAAQTTWTSQGLLNWPSLSQTMPARRPDSSQCRGVSLATYWRFAI